MAKKSAAKKESSMPNMLLIAVGAVVLLLIFAGFLFLGKGAQTSTGGTQTTGGEEVSATQISSCGKITQDSILSADIVVTGKCFDIAADNVKLDCDGHKVKYSGSESVSGILVDGKDGVTISNCTLEGFAYGVSVLNGGNIHIKGNTITNARVNGVKFYSVVGGEVSSNTIASRGEGIYLFSSPSVSITGNTVTENNFGIKIEQSENVIISSNTLCKNSEYDLSCDSPASGTGNKITKISCGGVQFSQC